jgi:hypothetical protein
MNTISKQTTLLTSLIVILTISLSACGPSATPTPAPTADVNAIYTQAAATIVGGITQTAAAMPSSTPVPPSATPESSATPTAASLTTVAPTPAPANLIGSTATPVPVDPSTAFGCYNATFMAHVTLPYAPPYNPGDHFIKTWRVKNTGSCDWPRGFKIMFISGDRFGANTIEIGQKVITGAVTEISLNMTAPRLTGVVSSNWQLATDIGKPFGSVLSVFITLPGTTSSGSTSGGCLNSALISDVSIPSGTTIKAGDSFTKTWNVKNTGTCEWTRDFKITYVGGDIMGSDTKKIRQVVGPGSSAEISLDMVAPGTTGTITSAWQMADDNGKLFGEVFGVSIVVK